MLKVLTIFGTRPEVIKLAPVIRELEARPACFKALNVSSSQHTELLRPLVRLFGIRLDHDLQVMQPNQTLDGICARVMSSLDPILSSERPDLLLVQGDTTTALASALSAFHHRVPVGHVEAGLRSGNTLSPYPEEMNRRLISRLASYHFAATARNRDTLLAEGVPADRVFLTGNPVVDALHTVLDSAEVSPETERLIRETEGRKRIVLTTHRRESFGTAMEENLRVLRRFVDAHPEVVLIFPVHPNPAVVAVAERILSGHTKTCLLGPLNYVDFIVLLSRAWLIVSDSGGVQEEAPSLGKPLLVLRENTERPEAVESGVARLVGGSPQRLWAHLEEAYRDDQWFARVSHTENPFGRGDSGKQIVEAILQALSPGAREPAGQVS